MQNLFGRGQLNVMFELRSSGLLHIKYWQFLTDVSVQLFGPFVKVQESKRKPVATIRNLYREECGR